MQGLPTLIRLQQRELDVLRRRMGLLHERRQKLLDRSQALLEELNNEVRLASEMPGMSGFFGDFSGHIKQQRLSLDKEIVLVSRKIDRLADEISEAYSELKKFEIAWERWLEEEKKRLEKIEQQQMDEIAARKHRNRREGYA